MTEILLIRHGETAWNVAMRLQGHLDIPLNEQGERQAAALGAHLQDEVLDAIVSSDLRRASQTAREIARRQGLPLHLDRGLRERCFGGFENLHYGEIERRYPQEFAAWKARDIDAVLPPGERPGETLRQFHERAIATILRLARRHRGRRIALVAHSGVLESAYLAAHGLAPDARYDFPILNARACYELKQGSRSSEKGGSARRGAPPGASPVQAPQRSDAPFSLEPFGQPREPAAYVVAAPCRSPLRRVATPSMRRVPGAARPLPEFITGSSVNRMRVVDGRLEIKAWGQVCHLAETALDGFGQRVP